VLPVPRLRNEEAAAGAQTHVLHRESRHDHAQRRKHQGHWQRPHQCACGQHLVGEGRHRQRAQGRHLQRGLAMRLLFKIGMLLCSVFFGIVMGVSDLIRRKLSTGRL